MSKRLKKSGTMKVSAQEGTEYLKRSWGDEKYNRIQKWNNVVSNDSAETSEKNEEPIQPAAKKAKLSKHSTMIATANESKEILKEANIDEDAKTRHQSKQIKSLIKPKIAKLSKHSTMINTLKESEHVLKDSKIDSDAKTRNQSKEIQKITKVKKVATKNKRSQLTTQKKNRAKSAAKSK